MIIKLTKDIPSFRKGSARAKWLAAIKRYDGKSVDEFLTATGRKPPIRSASGQAESPMGWLRFFERSGVIQIVGR